jgi:hypothetical protein
MISSMLCAVVLVVHGLVNSFSTKILSYMSIFSGGWHLVGVIVVSILLPCVAPIHQSASFVFTDFQGVGITTSELPLDNACIGLTPIASTAYHSTAHLVTVRHRYKDVLS